MMRNARTLSRATFGDLTPLGRDWGTYSAISAGRCRCRCTCGAIAHVSYAKLFSRTTTTCPDCEKGLRALFTAAGRSICARDLRRHVNSRDRNRRWFSFVWVWLGAIGQRQRLLRLLGSEAALADCIETVILLSSCGRTSGRHPALSFEQWRASVPEAVRAYPVGHWFLGDGAAA
jgi:hypothetical protein